MLTFAPHFGIASNALIKYKEMAVTQLKRKSRKNRAVANNKISRIKELSIKPEIRKVDVEEIKASFKN
ncbi:hypothetical protein SAMN06298216_0034 [Spirosomataceae bacterium TFI 002]|nr:hypothetical protein SAMN06298216_0034 [Spirosomataceae bacterium TFI 002]